MKKLSLLFALFVLLAFGYSELEARPFKKAPKRKRTSLQKAKKSYSKWAHLNRASVMMNKAKYYLRKRNVAMYNRALRVAKYHLRKAYIVKKRRPRGKRRPTRRRRYTSHYAKTALSYLNRNQRMVKEFPRLRKAPGFQGYKKMQTQGWAAYRVQKFRKSLSYAYRGNVLLRQMLVITRGKKRVPKEMKATKEEEAAAKEAARGGEGDDDDDDGADGADGDGDEAAIGKEADEAPESSDKEVKVEAEGEDK